MAAILKNQFTVIPQKACEVLTRVGQLAIVQDDIHTQFNGEILMLTYDSFVSLTDPNNTWHYTKPCELKVIVLHAGTVVEYVSEV